MNHYNQNMCAFCTRSDCRLLFDNLNILNIFCNKFFIRIIHFIFICFISIVLISCEEDSADSNVSDAATAYRGAVHKDDKMIVGWADSYKDYKPGNNCDLKWQTPDQSLGKAEGNSFNIVCLGDSGQITMVFNNPVINGKGADFAVFENSFSENFIELAFVEVSSNGIDFIRFNNLSKTSDAVSEYGVINFSNVYSETDEYSGFAGVHKQGYGTLFDLNNLLKQNNYSSVVDLNNIRYIRIIDIIGDGSVIDSSGNKIYDPYPQKESAGFDLDGVGVINGN